jgi:cation diffusion facilitator CzcD-associated flavoprotein CzcO
MANSQDDPGDRARRRCDVLVVGAGFAGVYGVYRYREQGLDVVGVEAAADVGGVWLHNQYPGARCDIESIDYSFSFSEEVQQEWSWTERFASQPEILEYLRFVAARYDLRQHFRFNTRVVSAHREATPDGDWRVGLSNGDEISCRFLVLATGSLSRPKTPDIPGLERFAGQVVRTSGWPAGGVEFGGRRVGLIGTGSSGIQAAPHIARDAERLYVLQRTPPFTLPAGNRPIDAERYARVKAAYPAYRREHINSPMGYNFPTTGRRGDHFSTAERREVLEQYWREGGMGVIGAFRDVMRNEALNHEVAEFVREKIRQVVADPATAKRLCPTDYPIGARRMCLDSGFYEMFNRDNVELVDLRDEPIVEVTPAGVETARRSIPLDVLVLAIGFDALSGAALDIDIRDAAGRPLAESWSDGPKTLLGMMTAGFPNLFIVTGPGGPSVFANMAPGVEHDIDWIGQAIGHLKAHGRASIEPTREAQENWMRRVADLAEATLYVKADSWYLGANIPGKPRRFLAYIGGFNTFTRTCAEVSANAYEGFVLA